MKFTNSIPAILITVFCATAHAEPFYKTSQLFTTAPQETKSVERIGNVGPVGIAIDLHQPAFTMWVGDIEPKNKEVDIAPGSPAEKAGLKMGQVIDSINGQTLKDIDPRIQLGRIIADAEASDGVLKLMVRENAKATEAKEVVINIPVLGAYSKTWPLDCPKSDQIIRNFNDYLAQPDSNKGFAGGGMLMLVASGTDKDLAVVREWVHAMADNDGFTYPWHISFAGIAVCEYYLKTGDPQAMKVINRYVGDAAKSEYLDGWSGRGKVVGMNYGRGHLNAGGTGVVTFLMLAKQCGAEINDSLLHRTLTHYFRYAGRGLNPYGDDRPETSFVDNGKNGNLAIAMAAAAALTPEGEDSIYARARDIAAMSAFYTTTYMLHGHTGGGVGEIWRSASMCLLQDTKPAQYRDFLDNRKWHYDMSRNWDGSFTILGGAKYETVEWGGCYPWVYVFPRKSLSITGAPPTKFSKTYQLPKRPWGTAADDVFLSLEAAPDKDGKRMDLSGETLAKDSAKPLIERLQAAGELSDDEIRRYARHPEFLIRHMVVNHAAGIRPHYMWREKVNKERPGLLDEFMRDADPRVRYAGLRAATVIFDPGSDWSKKTFDYAIERLKDDEESWFVKDICLEIVGLGIPDWIMPHIELLESYLAHEEQWLNQGALAALAMLSLDERATGRTMPVVGDFISKTMRQSTTGSVLSMLRKSLPEASPTVQAAAKQALGETYASYSAPLDAEGGLDLRGHRHGTLERFAETLLTVPGGAEVLYHLAKQEYPDKVLPHQDIFLNADFDSFSPEMRKEILPIVRDEVIYQFIGKNRNKLLGDIKNPVAKNGTLSNSLDELSALYEKVGVHDYVWKNFGPDLRNSEWDYFSYEPKEKQPYDKSPWRYRKVSAPEGMENWFKPEFDAAAADWGKGLPPFGQYKGKLDDNHSGGRNLWEMKPRTLWEKEVLLVRGEWQFPALKPGHAYRLRVHRGQGVGAGDGFKVFVNGKQVIEVKDGLGRRAGDVLRGGYITNEFTDAFAKGPVTVAALTFLRYGDRAIVQMPPEPQGIFSMWLEERKLPPLDAATFAKAATITPMLSSVWQAAHDPDSDEEPAEDLRYRYDGKFVSNPKLIGTWGAIATVDGIEAFDPGAKIPLVKPLFHEIELTSQGGTNSPRFIWSGEILMDLERLQALKMITRTLDGSDYLFVELGGFSHKNPVDWKSQWMVMEKK
jgi:hypothetical protein